MSKKLKVFHGLVNYGTQASLFAKELRQNGIDAISVVIHDSFDRGSDIHLNYSKKLLKRTIQRMNNLFRKFGWFFKYNTFHFYFGRSLFKNQWDLPFYRLFGKKVIFEYLGNDIRNYTFLAKRYNLPIDHPYHRLMKSHDAITKKRLLFEDKYVDYKLCCLPSHFRLGQAFDFKIDELLPLAVDLEKFKFTQLNSKLNNQPLNILHAPTNRILKGTEFIIGAINRLKSEGYDVNLKIVENASHNELLNEYISCDIFIAQLGLGWYGTVALEAMAIGRPTCAFIDKQVLKFIDYKDEIPIINMTKDNITEVLKELLLKRDQLEYIGKQSREFVEKYHDVKVVVKQLINIYQYKLWGELEH